MSFWGSYEPRIKAPTYRSSLALRLCLCGLGPIPGLPHCFRDALPGAHLDVGTSCVLMSLTPVRLSTLVLMWGGSDLTEGAWQRKVTSNAETQLQVEPWRSSLLVRWGLTCVSHKVWARITWHDTYEAAAMHNTGDANY